MSYRFLVEPKWLLSHLVVLALVVVMVNLGLWQLQRHDERADRNALVEERADADPVRLVEALTAADQPEDLQFVRTTARGVYQDDRSVLVANRTLDGSPGFWVMTPLALDGGLDLWVARGFVGRSTVAAEGPTVLAAPDGILDVTGILQVSADGGAFAEGDELPTVNRPDTAVLGSTDGADPGVYLQAEEDPSPLLTPIPPPPLDSGPHRSYAAQWFIFALIAVVGYPLILRKVARDRARREQQDTAGTLTADDALV